MAIEGPSPETFSKNWYPIPMLETWTVCDDTEDTDKGISSHCLPVSESVWLGVRSPIPEICARLREVMNGDSPTPPDTVEPAIETVTGSTNPPISGDMETIPEVTAADSGIRTVTLSAFVPSRVNEVLLEDESGVVISDCQPRFPYP